MTKKDKARAYDLLERGVKIQIEEARRRNSLDNIASSASTVARLAQIGRDTSYPGVSGLSQALCLLRITLKESRSLSDAEQANVVLLFPAPPAAATLIARVSRYAAVMVSRPRPPS